MLRPQLLTRAARQAAPLLTQHAARPAAAHIRPLSLTAQRFDKAKDPLEAATTAGEPGESGHHEGQFARTDESVQWEYPGEENLPSSRPVQGRAGWHFKRTLASFSLEGRVGIVTGGARGLGLVMAQALVNSGANVAIVDMNSKSPQWPQLPQLSCSQSPRGRGGEVGQGPDGDFPQGEPPDRRVSFTPIPASPSPIWDDHKVDASFSDLGLLAVFAAPGPQGPSPVPPPHLFRSQTLTFDTLDAPPITDNLPSHSVPTVTAHYADVSNPTSVNDAIAEVLVRISPDYLSPQPHNHTSASPARS